MPSAPFEHAFDRDLGLLDQVIVLDVFRSPSLQAGKMLGLSVPLLDTAVVASAVTLRSCNEGLVGQLPS